jgi:hypothetical protein
LTLTAALVVVQTGRALDDVADMFVRLVQKLHNRVGIDVTNGYR